MESDRDSLPPPRGASLSACRGKGTCEFQPTFVFFFLAAGWLFIEWVGRRLDDSLAGSLTHTMFLSFALQATLFLTFLKAENHSRDGNLDLRLASLPLALLSFTASDSLEKLAAPAQPLLTLSSKNRDKLKTSSGAEHQTDRLELVSAYCAFLEATKQQFPWDWQSRLALASSCGCVLVLV